MTGANYLVQTDTTKILVDCGLTQGGYFAEKQNFEKFPYEPASIQAVLVTHAHVDHTGKIPKLYKEGFKGTVYSTLPTKDFAELLLLDSEHILANEAEREHVGPLYSTEDIIAVMEHWKGVKYHEPLTVGDISVEFFDAGHILGSATIKVSAEGKSIIFSGDLGNSPNPIIKPTELMPEADYCVLESTYGDRIHENSDRRIEDLEDVIEETAKRGGALLIPAFAMERTQEILYHIHQLFEDGRIPKERVFLDSPLAIKVTVVYKKYENYFNKETETIVSSGDDILNFPELTLCLTTEQSKAINDVPNPKIIIAGSGMSQGGRILHHERRYLSDPNSTMLFVGYQTYGSLGRRILDGEKQVKIFGEEIQVKAQIRNLSSYSAHADQLQLVNWVYPQRERLQKVFVVQGEPEASQVLAQKLRDELAVDAQIPKEGEEIVL